MRKPSEPDESWDTLRDKIIGLGEGSVRKSYYPELQQRLAELERFRVLLDQSNDAIFLIQLPAGQVADANESACLQLGYSREELLNQPIDQLSSTDLTLWLRAQSTPPAGVRAERETFEAVVRRRSGETLPVEVTARRAVFQGADYAVVVARDITERRQAEAALRESEQKFRSIIEQSLDGIILLDADGHITEWNTGEEHITGLTRAEAIGRPVWDIEQQLRPTGSTHIDERVRLVIREMLRPELTARREFRQEVEIQRPGGERRIIHIAAFPIKTSAGYMIGSITRDITERQAAEAALRTSEERFRALFENSPVPIWEEDFSAIKDLLEDLKQRGVEDIDVYLQQHPEVVQQCAALVRITDVNRAALRMHGAASKEELFDGLTRVFTPESYATFQQELVYLWNGKFEMAVDGVTQTLTGERRHVTAYWSVSPGYEQTLAKVLVSIVDITERKQLLEQVQHQSAELEAIFAAMVDAVMVYGPDSRLRRANRAAMAAFGFDPVGHDRETLVRRVALRHMDGRAVNIDELPSAGALRGEVVSEGRFILTNAQGRDRLIRASATPLRAGDQAADAVIVWHDVTEREKLLAQVQHERERAEARAAELDAVFASMTEGVVLYAPDGTIVRTNEAAERFFSLTAVSPTLPLAQRAPLYKSIWEDGQPITNTDDVPVQRALRGEVVREVVLGVYSAQTDEYLWLEDSAAPVRDTDGHLLGAVLTFHDVTDRKQAEEEHQAHLRFFESMDQVNRAMQRTSDHEQMMHDVLDVVLSIFECDRAWLLYPCDPAATSFRVPMEITRPEYPGAKVLNVDVPMSPGEAQNMREALASDTPVIYIAGTDRPISTAKQFGVQSQMFVPVYPRLGKPWVFGLHQCSYPRVWTQAEQKLFQEIGRRLGDALASLLAYRDLRESEERFSTAFRHSPIAISIVRAADGRFVDVNNVFVTTSGYSREDIIGRTSNELDLWVNPAEQAPRLQELQTQSSVDTFEFHLRTKSGEIRIGLVATALIELGGEPHYLSLIHDITDRKRAEQEIIRLNRLYAVLSDINQAIVRLRDRQHLFEEACRVAVEVGQFRLAWIGRVDEHTQMLQLLARYGHTEGHFEHLPISLSEHISDRGDPSATAIREGHVFVSNDIEHDGPPAPWREVAFRQGHRSLAVLPLRVSGQIWGAIHFYSAERAFFDDRELRLLEELAADLAYAVESLQRDEQRKQAEEALRQAQKLESLGVLAGGVAHDFNNLLVAMLGQASLALVQLPADSAPRAHIEKAVGAARRAADLTRQLLAYSGRGQFQVLPVNLNTLIRENLHLFEVAIPKNVRLVSDLAESLPVIEGDVGQMQQIVMNLIINAAEAIGRKPGIVRVTTDTYYITPADVQVWKYIGSPLTSGLYTTLSVKDNGSGMDAATLSKVFDPFFTTKVTGRGLGLAAVLGIVRSHKGGLRVESEPGTGTTFTLYFPVSAAQPTTPVRAEPEPGAASTQGLVLVIDDEDSVREAATDILESVGLTVITAADGLAGLALYRERQADIRLVVLDLSMPGLSGEETFQELRRVNPQAAIILSSGYQQTEVTHRFASQRSVGFLQKPYDMTTLIQAVQQGLAA